MTATSSKTKAIPKRRRSSDVWEAKIVVSHGISKIRRITRVSSYSACHTLYRFATRSELTKRIWDLNWTKTINQRTKRDHVESIFLIIYWARYRRRSRPKRFCLRPSPDGLRYSNVWKTKQKQIFYFASE